MNTASEVKTSSTALLFQLVTRVEEATDCLAQRRRPRPWPRHVCFPTAGRLPAAGTEAAHIEPTRFAAHFGGRIGVLGVLGGASKAKAP